jgi:NitT/TauT family transport system ATP-binding protein
VIVMTASPARIKDDFRINLARPRDVEELRLTPEFIETYSKIWQSLSSEVETARAQGASRVA